MDKILFSLVFFYYLYTIALMFYIFTKRKKAVISGEVKAGYFKDYQSGGTSKLVILQNHFNNQFQIPVVFYITCVVAKQFEVINEITLGLALFFIVTRLGHSYIHLTTNKLMRRALAYFLGIVTVALMWLQILIQA